MNEIWTPETEELNEINETLEEGADLRTLTKKTTNPDEPPFKGFADAWEEERADLEKLATKDSLTGLDNRRGFIDNVQRLASRISPEGGTSQRKDRLTVLSIMLIDIDDFKKVNDTFGHDVGDVALKAIARTLKEMCRGEDIVGRWGGEEFIIAFPSARRKEILKKFGLDKDREKTARLPTTDIALSEKENERISLTMSAGIAEYHPGKTPRETQMKDIEETINRADKALYRAKAEGKNQILASTETIDTD